MWQGRNMIKLVVGIKFRETLFKDLEEIQSDKFKEIQIDRKQILMHMIWYGKITGRGGKFKQIQFANIRKRGTRKNESDHKNQEQQTKN